MSPIASQEEIVKIEAGSAIPHPVGTEIVAYFEENDARTFGPGTSISLQQITSRGLPGTDGFNVYRFTRYAIDSDGNPMYYFDSQSSTYTLRVLKVNRADVLKIYLKS